MSEYTLIYFNIQGRAETIRWIFAQAGIEYTDERIEWGDWPERKPDIPGGRLPVLMIGEKPLMQSMAIARYVAQEGNLVPEDNFEAAMCDALALTFEELMTGLWNLMKGVDDEEDKKKLFEEEFCPNYFEPLMRRLNGRLEGREWFAGDDITWADLVVGRCLNQITSKHPECLENFPNVASHLEKVCELPAIKEWIENRPETSY